jgi:hypothetical protein
MNYKGYTIEGPVPTPACRKTFLIYLANGSELENAGIEDCRSLEKAKKVVDAIVSGTYRRRFFTKRAAQDYLRKCPQCPHLSVEMSEDYRFYVC